MFCSFKLRLEVLLVLVALFMMSCESRQREIEKAFLNREFKKAAELIDEEIKSSQGDSLLVHNLQYKINLMNRIRLDFSLSEEDVRHLLAKYYPTVTDSMLRDWEQSGYLEMRMLDGEKRYFNRAVDNFFRINKQAKALRDSVDGKQVDGIEKFKSRYLSGFFNDSTETIPGAFDERRLRIDYSIVLKANAVPEGEKVRCWMPFPRLNSARLKEIELLTVNEPDYILAPEGAMQRSLYMERKAVKDSATVFRISYRILTSAQWCNAKAEDVSNYDTKSEMYREYTRECPPHIIFSDSIRNLALQIVGNETNPLKQVRLLYYWLDQHIPWAGALEYSIMNCIPEYVLNNRRGDCGMQTFLFLSMARSVGIPCKWQSGWYLMPEETNLHDWAEVYYNGIGWVPVDVSFKLTDSPDKRIKEFYLNGLDSYRLIINDDIGQAFYPNKKYPRSEPFDFQRGELEWRGGNLYFDKWTYHLDVWTEQ